MPFSPAVRLCCKAKAAMYNRSIVYWKQLNKSVLNGAQQTKAGLQLMIIVTANRQTGSVVAIGRKGQKAYSPVVSRSIQ
ncbi:MAG: hypothetical protein ACJ751_04965 [Niastella sp.]|uniref:hypothetical protein n=1 Tax=Niastella sp. TaxID=1869183 RepID=UPI00389A0342